MLKGDNGKCIGKFKQKIKVIQLYTSFHQEIKLNNDYVRNLFK